MKENLKNGFPVVVNACFSEEVQTRVMSHEEIAALALFLCSDEASFITGSDYPIDGGFLNLRG